MPTQAAIAPGLPSAHNGLEWIQGLPEVRLRDDKVLLDGQVVDNLAEVEQVTATRRKYGIHAELRRYPEMWKEANPKKEYPGIASFFFDARTPYRTVLRLVTVVGFSGHVHAALAVRAAGDPNRITRVDVDALMPYLRIDPMTGEGDGFLAMEVGPTGVSLLWDHIVRGREALGPPASAPGSATFHRDLAAVVESAWKAHGHHRDASDRVFDHAAVRGTPDLPLQTFIDALDALYEVRRDVMIDGKVARVPALKVVLWQL